MHCTVQQCAWHLSELHKTRKKEAAGLRCTKAQGGMLLLAKGVKAWLGLSWFDFTQSGLAELGAE